MSRTITITISVFEVCRWTRRELGSRRALEAMALMQQGRIVDLDSTLAMNAARLSVDLKLPMADSITLATARAHAAVTSAAACVMVALGRSRAFR